MAEKIRKGKKGWVTIVGNGDFRNNLLGESYVYSAQDLVGKSIKVNLAHLTGEFKRQNVNIKFNITGVEGSQAKADFAAYELMTAHVKRVVRAGKDKIDDSFDVETKDKRKIRVKSIILTRNKTSNSVLGSIRMTNRKLFSDIGKENTMKDILGGVVNGQLPKSIRIGLKKTYPLAAYEIRKLVILN